MRDLWQDLRHTLRVCRGQPGFTAAVLITLALGIGASTAMFSVLNAVLLQPLPQENAARIVRLYQPDTNSETTGLSPLEIVDYKAQARLLDDVVEYHSMPFTFIGAGEAQRLQTGVVSAQFFDALGVRPLIGRGFRRGEDQPGAPAVLMLSYEYWQREFGGSASVVGSTLRMNDRTHTVVGVLPPIPQYPNENAIYMPISSCPFRAQPGWAENRTARGAALGLVRTGVTQAALETELQTIASRLHAEHPDAYPPERRMSVAAVPLTELIARPARTTLVVLLGATLLLLVIVCSNVGNLMIVRLLRRNAELAVRSALGATRTRLTRQLLTESAVLAAIGGALGIMVALASTGMLAAFVSRFTPRASEIRVDGTVALFALGATSLAALASGLLPLTAMRAGVASVLRQSSNRASASGAHARIRATLIVVQVAVSLVLLVGAGLLMRTVVHLQRVDTGFDPAGVMTARLDLNWTKYDSPDLHRQFYLALERELRIQPGVTAVGLGSTFPLNDNPAFNVSLSIEAMAASGEEPPRVAAMTVSPGYFDALGVPLLSGRTFNSSDEVEDAEPVGIVTRSLAERYFPGVDPIDRRISLDGGQSWGRVIGVVADVRLGLENEYDDVVFAPHYRNAGMSSRLLVRGEGGPLALERAIRGAVAAADPQQPITDVIALETHRGERLAPYRLTGLLMSMFALVALGVTAVGLAGVIAFSIAQRTREIGIRIAVGAGPVRVLRLVLGQTLLLAAAGAVIGAAVAYALVGALRDMVVGIAIVDPLTFAGVAVLLMAVVAVAGYLPARRALRVDPLIALHDR